MTIGIMPLRLRQKRGWGQVSLWRFRSHHARGGGKLGGDKYSLSACSVAWPGDVWARVVWRPAGWFVCQGARTGAWRNGPLWGYLSTGVLICQGLVRRLQRDGQDSQD